MKVKLYKKLLRQCEALMCKRMNDQLREMRAKHNEDSLKDRITSRFAMNIKKLSKMRKQETLAPRTNDEEPLSWKALYDQFLLTVSQIWREASYDLRDTEVEKYGVPLAFIDHFKFKNQKYTRKWNLSSSKLLRAIHAGEK